MNSRTNYPDQSGPGFTLIEVLLSMAVVSVLVALFLPGLGEARWAGRTSRTISLQSQMIAALHTYTQASKDTFPYMGVAGSPLSPIVVHGVPISIQGYFTDQSKHWASLVIPDFADAPPAALQVPGEDSKEGVIRSFHYLTETAFADPRLFKPGVFAPPRAYFRATRTTEVVFASRKGLLLDVSLGKLAINDRHAVLPVGFADGSASLRAWSDVDWSRVVNQPMSNNALPVLNTRDGLAGIDF